MRKGLKRMKLNWLQKESLLAPFFVLFSSLIISVLLLHSCAEKKKPHLSLDNCPIVATKDGDLTTLDFSLVEDEYNFPISALLSSFELIRLENSEKALTGGSFAFAISENYIGLFNSSMPGQYKLFKRTGEYVCDLSSPGQGPNEFLFGIIDSYIDEKNEKVYLLSYRDNKLMVFDLKGNPLEHIPFPFNAFKGHFIVDEEKQKLLMMNLPFMESTYAIWQQDFKGNIIQGVDSKPFKDEYVEYSCDVNLSFNTSQLDYSVFYWLPLKQDSIYHYNELDNSLNPVFTTKWREGEILRHIYTELPNHYLLTIVNESATPTYSPRYPRIIVDKHSLRGCYINLKFNMLGNIDGPPYISCHRGYCIADFFPHELKEQLEKVLSRPEKLKPEMKEYLKKLNENITEDDNNILFIGKLKI